MREHLSHNVVLNLIIAACCGLADSIWTGTIGVAFISDVWHTNKRVGIATALTGLAALASALPAGWAADRYGRAKVCRVGSLAILVAAPAYAYATLRATEGKDRELAYILICIASAFFGLSSGIINGPAQALLADSVSTGARSKVYTWLFACYIVPSVLGPAISVGYFEAHGDEWRLPLLRDLTLLGMALEVPVAILCCCFRDDKALGESSDAVQDQERAAASASTPGDVDGDADRPKASDAENAENDAEAPPDDQCDERDDAVDPRIKMIPYVVFCTDLVVALGSGCTIKFFPLWFKNDLSMSPAAVQGIYCGVPLSMALASGFCTALSRPVWKSKFYGAFVLNRRVDLHAIDAAPAR
jgi:MFS family permease